MKRIHVFFGVIGVAAAAAACGYWYGLRQGAESSVAFTSALNATTSLMYLEAIRDGRINGYDVVMESEVDNALFINHYLEEAPAFRILPPPWGKDAEGTRRKSLTRLADYRKGHASPNRPEALEALLAQIPESQRGGMPEITPELRESMLHSQAIIEAMVARYASAAPKGQ